MGVINITPDSFSDGGEFYSHGKAVEQALRLELHGADIIDIGGESSRPGSDPVPADEELRRVMPVIEALVPQLQIPISIDTYKSKVAAAALKAGCAIVNDITALEADPKMAHVVASHAAGVILMHKRGAPKEMQENTDYDDLVVEVSNYLAGAVRRARTAGIASEKIMIDPGIGFGKDLAGNLLLLKSVQEFSSLGYPVLIGASRKAFIGSMTGAEVGYRVTGSIAVAVTAVLYGAAAVRVHDVAETRQAVDVAIRLRKGS
jgi:dihydropteroate synthase